MAAGTVAAQAEKKADAKVEADVKVATEPDAIHKVGTMIGSPAVIASTVVGGLAGAAFLPMAVAVAPVTALVVGSVAGALIEKHRIAGGPVGKVWRFASKMLGRG